MKPKTFPAARIFLITDCSLKLKMLQKHHLKNLLARLLGNHSNAQNTPQHTFDYTRTYLASTQRIKCCCTLPI
jgi:hypothetical protein